MVSQAYIIGDHPRFIVGVAKLLGWEGEPWTRV